MNFSNNKICGHCNKNETWNEFACLPKQNYILSLLSFEQKIYVLVKRNPCSNLLKSHSRV